MLVGGFFILKKKKTNSAESEAALRRRAALPTAERSHKPHQVFPSFFIRRPTDLKGKKKGVQIEGIPERGSAQMWLAGWMERTQAEN